MRTSFSLVIITLACSSLVAAAPTPTSANVVAHARLPDVLHSLSVKRGQGGSAFSGDTDNANAGDIVNEGDTVDNATGASEYSVSDLIQGEKPNQFTDTANDGGSTVTGDAVAGNGSGSDGTGGNASSGSAGSANGGSVYNYGGDITNAEGASKSNICILNRLYLIDSCFLIDTAGAGGSSFSGNAYGGNASGDSDGATTSSGTTSSG